MALGPRFSANKFQAVLKGALGGGADTVRGALLHIGAQKSLQTGASVKDAQKIIQKLKASGAITNEDHARAVFKSAERVANAAERMRVSQVKADRMAEFNAASVGKPSSLAQSIVDAHQHSTSINQTATQHYTSIADALKKPVMGGSTGSATSKFGGLMGAASTRPIIDIPIG